MRINVARMIEATEGVENIPELTDFLNKKGVEVCERTLYRWKSDRIGFNETKVRAAAKAVNMKLEDIIILA